MKKKVPKISKISRKSDSFGREMEVMREVGEKNVDSHRNKKFFDFFILILLMPFSSGNWSCKYH